MPRTYKPRKAPVRRRRMPMRRRAGKGPTIRRVPNAVIADKMIVKVPYTDYQVVRAIPTQTGGSYAEKTYSLNSIYDPEPGALNTYPLGWSQWSALYQRYRVFAVSYRISLHNLSDDTGTMGSLFISNTDDTAVPSNANITTFLTQPHSRRWEIGNKTGGKNFTTLTGKIYLPRHAGMTSEQYRTNDQVAGYLGSLGATPANEITMKIRAANTNIGVAQGTYLYATVNLMYHVELFDRLPLSTGISDAPDQPDGEEENLEFGQ